jgi:heme/copper-type cytochrome/quinol oxidase subunit 2
MMPSTSSNRTIAIGAALLIVVTAALCLERSAAAQTKRAFNVSAHRYAFVVSGQATPRIEVQQGDVVQITFSADDIPHSFTIDEYRIAKRAEPGHPVTFEILADKLTNGPVVFYCNLAIDDGCRKMRGEFVVTRHQRQ